jgi:hypothetical protein
MIDPSTTAGVVVATATITISPALRFGPMKEYDC